MEDDDFDSLLAVVDFEEVAPSPPTPAKQPRLLPSSVDDTAAAVSLEGNDPGTSKDSKPKQPKSHCVLVNQKQRGNPLLKSITSVPWEFDDVVADYEIGKTMGVLFVSLRYHNMNPDYINDRLKELGKKYELRVLLVQVDLKEPHVPLKSLTRICLLADLTLMLAWNSEEAGKIIENYKIFENKPPDKIMEKIENDPHQKIVNALSSIKPVNKTDAMTLITTFGSLANIIKSSEARLAQCPGFAARKAHKLHKALHEPFLKKNNLPAGGFDVDINVDELEKIESEIQS